MRQTAPAGCRPSGTSSIPGPSPDHQPPGHRPRPHQPADGPDPACEHTGEASWWHEGCCHADQLGRICTIPDLARPDCASVQIGGYSRFPQTRADYAGWRGTPSLQDADRRIRTAGRQRVGVAETPSRMTDLDGCTMIGAAPSAAIGRMGCLRSSLVARTRFGPVESSPSRLRAAWTVPSVGIDRHIARGDQRSADAMPVWAGGCRPAARHGSASGVRDVCAGPALRGSVQGQRAPS